MSDFPAGDEENISSSPIRRGVMIAASIVTGIALGVGGYLFFTAGNKQQPVHKQVTKVLPAPSAGTPATPATPGDKQGRITEIPVKQEQEDQGTAKQRQAKVQEPAAPEGKVTGKLLKRSCSRQRRRIQASAGPAEGQYYVQAGSSRTRITLSPLPRRSGDGI